MYRGKILLRKCIKTDTDRENTKTSMPSYVQNLQVHCKIAFSNHK